MSFGNQTVGFVVVTLGDPDRNGVRARNRTQVNVHGCRFRPLTAREKVAAGTVATAVWKVTAPPHANLLAAESIDELVYDGTTTPTQSAATTYHLTGAGLPFPDMGGAPFKVTILCQKQKG